MSTTLTTPRPAPNAVVPVLAGGAAIALALPIFAVAGWSLGGWLLAAVLWLAGQSFGYLLLRLRTLGNLAASGVAGIGMMIRAIGVMVVLFAVAVSGDSSLAISAAVTYAVAYTVELLVSLVSYFGSPPA